MHTKHLLGGLGIGILSMTAGCMIDAGDPIDMDEENVAETAQAIVSVTPMATNTSTMTSASNGKKIVHYDGTNGSRGFHSVYTYNVNGVSTVRYELSADGINWSTFSIVDVDNATNPAVAVSADGTIGIVYIKNTASGAGDVYFRRRNKWGTWDDAIKMTNDAASTGGRTPSIVAEGTNFHVAWVKNPNVRHVTFYQMISQPLASASTVNAGIDSASESYQPALMVGPGPSSTKVVRVAWLEKQPHNGDPMNKHYTKIAEFSGGAWQPPILNELTQWLSYYTIYAVAADVNPVTGDSYVLTSYAVGGASPVLRLWYDNTLTAPSTYVSTTVNGNLAAVGDIVARNDACGSKFRILYTTANTWNGAVYRTGTWTSGGAPTWLHAATTLPGNGRAMGALLHSMPIPNTNQSNYFFGMYEQDNASYDVGVAYEAAASAASCN